MSIAQNVPDDGRIITFQWFNVSIRSVAYANQALQGAFQEMFVVALQLNEIKLSQKIKFKCESQFNVKKEKKRKSIE